MTLPAVPPEDAPEQGNGQAPPTAPGQLQLPLGFSRVEMEYHGPLPPAQELMRYEQVHPGLAERIVGMAEREQAHRHRLEQAEVEEPFRLGRRGQVCATLVVALVLGFCGYLAAIDHAVVAGFIAALDVLGLVIVFITGQAPAGRRKEDEPADGPDDGSPPRELPEG